MPKLLQNEPLGPILRLTRAALAVMGLIITVPIVGGGVLCTRAAHQQAMSSERVQPHVDISGLISFLYVLSTWRGGDRRSVQVLEYDLLPNRTNGLKL